MEHAAPHRVAGDLRLAERGPDEVDRATGVAGLGGGPGRLLEDDGPIDVGRERARIDLRPQLEASFEERLRLE